MPNMNQVSKLTPRLLCPSTDVELALPHSRVLSARRRFLHSITASLRTRIMHLMERVWVTQTHTWPQSSNVNGKLLIQKESNADFAVAPRRFSPTFDDNFLEAAPETAGCDFAATLKCIRCFIKTLLDTQASAFFFFPSNPSVSRIEAP